MMPTPRAPGRRLLPFAWLLVSSLLLPAQEAIAPRVEAAYFPPRGTWASREPAAVGLDAERLAAAVAFARENETEGNRDLPRWIRATLGNEPHGEIIGPARPRGAMSGVVIRRGYVVASWGPVDRVDMTFSVTKTYLSTVVGLAVARGLIPKVEDPVHRLVPTEHFASEHARKITWDHLLRQTSDWRGTLFTKPAWADRPPRGASLEEMQSLPLRAPGSAWEYNDVRVNLLALAALQVLREPLPVVLRREIMDPIGASPTWRWHGYETSWVTLDGQKIQSVSGGGHWGGGMFINTMDQARFGYLFLRDGLWKSRRLVAKEWIEAARTPTEVRPDYGYMNWFLNTARTRRGRERRPLPAAPPDAVTFRGAGSNIVYVDRANDLLVVVRWLDRRALPEFIARVLLAL